MKSKYFLFSTDGGSKGHFTSLKLQTLSTRMRTYFQFQMSCLRFQSCWSDMKIYWRTKRYMLLSHFLSSLSLLLSDSCSSAELSPTHPWVSSVRKTSSWIASFSTPNTTTTARKIFCWICPSCGTVLSKISLPSPVISRIPPSSSLSSMNCSRRNPLQEPLSRRSTQDNKLNR
jgi:hypothetical protein